MTRSRPAPGVVVAIALALVGLGLLLGAPASGSNPALAAVLALVPAAAFAATTVINRTAVPGLDPMLLTGLSFSFGSLLLLPAAALLGGQMYPSGGGQVALVLWLAIGPTALAYVAYFAGLRTVPGTTASVLALLEPLTASVGAAVVFGERLGLAGMIGAGLLVAGIVVLRRTPTMAPGPPLM